MDFERIKNLVKRNGDKLILVENGEPEAVVMSFAEYARITGNGSAADPIMHPAEERFDIPNVQTRLASWIGGDALETEFVATEEPPVPDRPLHLADIRLEDLPI